MRKDHESLSNYLLRLHKESLGFEYAFNGTRPSPLITKYKDFIKFLNFHEEMTDAEEKVFCEFLKANSTLKKTITKVSASIEVSSCPEKMKKNSPMLRRINPKHRRKPHRNPCRFAISSVISSSVTCA